MLYKLERNGKATEYYWQRGDSSAFLLGDIADLVKLYDQLGNTNTVPDLPELPAEEPCYTVPEAVSAALAAGLDTSKRRLGVTIRSAARAGRIAGAYRTPEGYWRLPVAAFNAWIAEHAEQKRGRPRKEAAPEHHSIIDQLDAYTVHIWLNLVSGDMYAVKRDSTGIVVGAVGPLDLAAARQVRVWNVDWSLDLAHTLRVDRILGGYEEVVIGDA